MPSGSTESYRIMIPYKKGYKRARSAYVAYTWVRVFAQRKVDLENELLLLDCHPGFDDFKESIFAFAQNDETPIDGFFVLVDDEDTYVPQELSDRGKVPKYVDGQASHSPF